MIVGVTGYFAAGKDTVAEYLVGQKGFEHLSLSDLIREALRAEGREVTIPNLTEKGNEIRRAEGPGALGERALRAMTPGADTVVTSIRHPAEVAALRGGGSFALIFVDAPLRTRYERSVARGRSGDFESFEAFAAAEEAQRASPDSSAQQLDATRAMADIILINDGDLDTLHAAIDRSLADLG